MTQFNVTKITKEVERIYGIDNPNVINTVLKEAKAREMLALLEEIQQKFHDGGYSEGEVFGQLETKITTLLTAIEKK